MFKGKKMAGHMGDVQVTKQNLEVVSTDADRGLILVKGAIPGAKGGYILISDAIKKPLPDGVPMPGAMRGSAAADEAPAEDQPEEAIEEVTEDQAQDAAPAEDTGAEEAAGQEKED
ncbi:MAG: hypothetical protein HOO19_03620 [Rhodospirillaceae bacterium]|nr:hypothetical protein [Rhodospirillaceae bacterium]